MSHVKRAWEQAPQWEKKKHFCDKQVGSGEGGGGGGWGEGKCASATFSFPNQLLGSLCLPNVFCHFTLFFAFSPTSELGPMLLKKFIHLTNDSLR